jgi:hypothetical protein
MSDAQKDVKDLTACFAFAKWIGVPVDLAQGPKALDEPWAYALYGLAQFLTDHAIDVELTYRAHGGKLVEIELKHTDTGKIRMRVIFNPDGSKTIVETKD